jgi:hypothetical protein
MATLPNPAISIFRRSGHTSIPAARRQHAASRG